MKDILSEIIANKRFEIDLQKQAIPSEQLQEKLSDEIQPGYSMKQALTSSSTGIIAEFNAALHPKDGFMKTHAPNR